MPIPLKGPALPVGHSHVGYVHADDLERCHAMVLREDQRGVVRNARRRRCNAQPAVVAMKRFPYTPAQMVLCSDCYGHLWEQLAKEGYGEVRRLG